MKLNGFFSSVGGDYGEAKARFQSDERIARFLRMFPGDDSMQNLSAAVSANDAPTAFRAVHTLKGVALNLGLGALAEASSKMTEALRGSDTLPADPEFYATVHREYGKVREMSVGMATPATSIPTPKMRIALPATLMPFIRSETLSDTSLRPIVRNSAAPPL